MSTLLSLKEYENIAESVLSKSYPNYYKYIKSDSDRFGEVVSGLIMADQNYNKDIGNIFGYRKQCVFWTIHHIINRDKKHNNLSIDINYANNGLSKKENIEDKTCNQYEYIDLKDEIEFLKKRISNNKVLNINQLNCLKLFLEYQDIDKVSQELEWDNKKTKACLKNSLTKLGKYDGYIKRFVGGQRRRKLRNRKTIRTELQCDISPTENA